MNDLVLDFPRQTSRLPTEQATAAEGKARASDGLFGKDGFSFWDFLDIINPLQHIPVVSTVYRAITGDTIDPGARIAGGGLFGGPIGVAISLIGAMVEESTGKDPGEHALAMLGIDIGPTDKSEPAVQVAEAPPTDRVPPELTAAIQPPLLQSDMKLTVRRREEEGESEQRRRGEEMANETAEIESQHRKSRRRANSDAAQLTDPSAILAAHARRLQGNVAPAKATPAVASDTADGRTWFAAFPQGGGTITRGVGTQPVTRQHAVSKFGIHAAPAAQGTARRGETPSSAEWAERAAAAYQKYFDMQQQRERRSGTASQVDQRY